MPKVIINTLAGIGFPGLLALLLIALKLCNVINLSWWWVLSPLWIPLSMFALLGLVSVLILLGVWLWTLMLGVWLWSRKGGR